ncbi:MAG: hypothetical protein KGV44_12700 [Flavobacteriaceae bacterium]|nr:hypothetical protein [Flavobacteriaceae bacterium]
METKSNKLWFLIVIGLLFLGLIGLGIYTFQAKKEHDKITNEIKQEKNEIASNLDDMIVKYEDEISKNTSLSTELEVERDRIVLLRDSIKTLKKVNYRLIKKYRKQIANLQLLNQRLFRKNDSLRSANESLALNLANEKKKVEQHQSRIENLTKKNYELEGKVTVGSVLKADKFTITALKKRSSGRLVTTSRSSRVEAMRVSFFVQKNIIADKGKKTAYIQIKNQSGEVVGVKKGKLELSTGDKITYSNKIDFDYDREEQEVVDLVNIVKGSMEKGFTEITVYIDGYLAGGASYKIKW